MEVSDRHARTRAIIRDTFLLQISLIRTLEMCRETSHVSFLMCPFVSVKRCLHSQHHCESTRQARRERLCGGEDIPSSVEWHGSSPVDRPNTTLSIGSHVRARMWCADE
jgi:hypothetical protein